MDSDSASDSAPDYEAELVTAAVADDEVVAAPASHQPFWKISTGSTRTDSEDSSTSPPLGRAIPVQAVHEEDDVWVGENSTPLADEQLHAGASLDMDMIPGLNGHGKRPSSLTGLDSASSSSSVRAARAENEANVVNALDFVYSLLLNYPTKRYEVLERLVRLFVRIGVINPENLDRQVVGEMFQNENLQHTPLPIAEGDDLEDEEDQIILGMLFAPSGHLSQDYRRGAVLGQGGFGVVVQVQNKLDKKDYALKIIKSSKENEEHDITLREIEMLSTLDHPLVVRYAGARQVTVHLSEQMQSRDVICISMELCDHTLSDWMVMDRTRALSDEDHAQQCHMYFRQVVEAVHYIHEKKITHRDITPNNIFLKETQQDVFSVKLGDFGLAREYHKPLSAHSLSKEEFAFTDEDVEINSKWVGLSEAGGTQTYSAPEQCKPGYDEKCDIFSLGIIFYEMLSRFKTAMERAKVLPQLRQSMSVLILGNNVILMLC